MPKNSAAPVGDSPTYSPAKSSADLAPAPADLSDLSARDGLIYRGGAIVHLPEADELAAELGFTGAERLVRALEKRQAEPTAAQLVDALWELNRQRNHLDGEIAQLEAALIATGPGKHTGDDPEHSLNVVAASEGSEGKIFYALAVEDKDKAVAAAKTEEAEQRARDLAGEEFANLFDRHVSFTPTEGFELIAQKILTPAKSRDLLALCQRVGKDTSGRKAYILGLPKPAKK